MKNSTLDRRPFFRTRMQQRFGSVWWNGVHGNTYSHGLFCAVSIALGVVSSLAVSVPTGISHSWVEEGPSAKRLQASIKKLGPEETLKAYKRAAENGEAEAQFYMAFWCMEGKVLNQDNACAVWLRKSAEQGYALSQILLGSVYFEGSLGVQLDMDKAHAWFLKGAANGDVWGEFALAGFYLEGTHKYVDKAKAIDLLKKAAEKGFADAQTQLAFCYANGSGEEADMEKGAYWMEVAATQGQAYAQFEMGLYFYHGRLARGKDLGVAIEWIRKAALQGHPTAEYTLAGLYARGEGVGVSPELAMEWGLKAADHGHIQAQVEMARSYMIGSGVEKDKGKAVQWFRKAAKGGDLFSQEALMYLYESGDGVRSDLEESTKWALKAAMNGNINAQIRMIHAYGEGLGVEKDHAQAYAWALIVAYNGESKFKKDVDHVFSLDDKVEGHRRVRSLRKEIKRIAEQRRTGETSPSN